MSCFLPTLPQTFITEWHTHGNVPPCPSSGYFIGNCLFLKGNWSTGGGFTFPLMQTGNCSQLQWSYTEAWRADTLLGSVFTPNAIRMLGWLRRSSSGEGSLPPALAQHCWGHTWSSQYKPDLGVLEWVMEGRLRGRHWGPGQRESPGGTWPMCIKTWQGGIKTGKAFLSAHWKDNRQWNRRYFI